MTLTWFITIFQQPHCYKRNYHYWKYYCKSTIFGRYKIWQICYFLSDKFQIPLQNLIIRGRLELRLLQVPVHPDTFKTGKMVSLWLQGAKNGSVCCCDYSGLPAAQRMFQIPLRNLIIRGRLELCLLQVPVHPDTFKTGKMVSFSPAQTSLGLWAIV